MTEMPPYFINPVLQRLRSGACSPDEERRLRRVMGANIGDVSVLRLLLGVDPEEFGSFYPDMEGKDLSTEDTIDTFLKRFGNPQAPTPQAAASIPVFGDEPMPDLADIMSELREGPHAGQHEAPRAEQPEAPRAEQPEEHRQATMADANALIKARDYEGALQIISRLSLLNPQKSVYFADQIRFLKKLIVNQRGV